MCNRKCFLDVSCCPCVVYCEGGSISADLALRHSDGCVLQMYDSKRFTDAGFRHYELYFPDGSCPPDPLTAKFLDLAEREPGKTCHPSSASVGAVTSLFAEATDILRLVCGC